MVTYPNALQPPPPGVTLPERFRPLTQVTGGSGNPGPTSTGASTGTTGSTAATRTNGTSALSLDPTTGDSAGTPAITPIDVSLPSSNNTLLVDPSASTSNSSALGAAPTNVGNHVLNNQGEVDGSAIGLGKADPQNANPPSDADDQGLSTGAKAGAIAGGLVTFFILVAIAVLAKKLHRAKASKRGPRHSTMIERQRSSSLTEHGSDYAIHPHGH
ncbi:hypothetical protein PTTG_08903 [Puccinia triticina 1-1 BBBD Race 1]|uniref:Uncharacterized protein n=1 Tax=Puccinia triticina (isolate 1-1 / race 1 (BBBD)) TaxID=630390 RepID=A0A180H2X5_PUCT1|nr:hypothetical protein PTTG_08903 [Puccinia triticina 1-1 BBBD Race 1]